MTFFPVQTLWLHCLQAFSGRLYPSGAKGQRKSPKSPSVFAGIHLAVDLSSLPFLEYSELCWSLYVGFYLL